MGPEIAHLLVFRARICLRCGAGEFAFLTPEVDVLAENALK